MRRMKNGKDKNQENLPPSLFDNLDLFQPAADAAGGKPAANAKPKAATSREPKATNHEQRTTNHEPRTTPPDL